MYTTHGHQIKYTPVEGVEPEFKARCGGPLVCTQCSRESAKAQNAIIDILKNQGQLKDQRTLFDVGDLRNTRKKETNMDVQTFERTSFQVEAVQVNEDNAGEVAAWCEGTIITDADGSFYIKARTHNPRNEKQKRAYPTDWAVKTDVGIKFYTDKAFRVSFAKKYPETIPEGDMLDIKAQAPKTLSTHNALLNNLVRGD